ncbi:MAG: formyltransferase [Armatimonadetes bacterium]|nr:formyltransferase [Armatimonadota bacterium]
MRALVFGYHDVGYECLEELVAQGHEVAAVVTHEDDPCENVWFRSVPALARDCGLPVMTPADPNVPDVVDALHDLAPDIIFSFYYRHMLKRALLELAPMGALNLHGSYLPFYRGRCPVNWVLLHGESETGVTLHHMVEKPDAGDIVAQRKVAISFDDTALTLYAKMTRAAREMFAEVLPALAAGTAPRIPQDHSRATYFGGRRPQDGRFQWGDRATDIYNLVRAVTHPYPGAFAEMGGTKLTVWWCRPGSGMPCGVPPIPGMVLAVGEDGPRIATGEGWLELLSVQVGDGPVMDGRQFVAAYGLEPGDDLFRGAGQLAAK